MDKQLKFKTSDAATGIAAYLVAIGLLLLTYATHPVLSSVGVLVSLRYIRQAIRDHKDRGEGTPRADYRKTRGLHAGRTGRGRKFQGRWTAPGPRAAEAGGKVAKQRQTLETMSVDGARSSLPATIAPRRE